MPHAELVTTLTIALAAAVIAGALAKRIGVSPLVGYLLAGIALGPRMPGTGVDSAIAQQLAEIGIVLLMFGVGLHFSPGELASVRAIAIPGALVQTAAATGLGLAAALALGWSPGAGLVLGLALGIASTVVLMRGLLDHGLARSSAGRIAVGWLIVEDLVAVVVLVLLPMAAGVRGEGAGADAGAAAVAVAVAVALLKIGAIAAFILVAGRRVVPWILERVARLRSRELFTLAVLAIALGIALGASLLTGASLALGAFLAGMAVGQSDLSLEAAADALPLRDAFAVLFFVSVGMLFDPSLLRTERGMLLMTLGIVVVAKPLIALVIVLALGQPLRSALTVAAGLAQIGEFSFILGTLGSALGLLPPQGQGIIVAVALVSIALNPLLFRLVGPLDEAARRVPWLSNMLATGRPLRQSEPELIGKDHIILAGHGHVGAMIRELMAHRGREVVVIEQDRRVAAKLLAESVTVVFGDASNALVLEHAGLQRARCLVLTFGDAVSTRLTVAHALQLRPGLRVIARAATEGVERDLRQHGGVSAIVGTRESALEMARLLLLDEGAGPLESEALLMDLRTADGGGMRRTRLVEVRISETSSAVGRTLGELGLPPGARVVLLEREGRHEIAHGRTPLAVHDRLLVFADEEGQARLEAVLR